MNFCTIHDSLLILKTGRNCWSKTTQTHIYQVVTKVFCQEKVFNKVRKKKHESSTFSVESNHQLNLWFSVSVLVIFQIFQPRNLVATSQKADKTHFRCSEHSKSYHQQDVAAGVKKKVEAWRSDARAIWWAWQKIPFESIQNLAGEWRCM